MRAFVMVSVNMRRHMEPEPEFPASPPKHGALFAIISIIAWINPQCGTNVMILFIGSQLVFSNFDFDIQQCSQYPEKNVPPTTFSLLKVSHTFKAVS